MPSRFGYRAANASGTVVEGEIDAPSEQGAIDLLRRRALWATDVWPHQSRTRGTATRGIPAGALAAVTRALSTLIASGVSLEEALAYASAQSPALELRTAFASVRQDVRNGRSLAEAMRVQDGVFPPLFPALAATGEATGTLHEALARLAEHLERNDELKARIRAALLYPSLLGVAAFFGVSVIMLVVVPRFAELLAQAGGALPLSTQVLLTLSRIVTSGWPVFLALAVALLLGWRKWSALPRNRLRWDSLRLKWPVVGDIDQARAAATYTRTLALALPSGIDLLAAMRLARAGVLNRALAERLEYAETQVRDGARLAASVSDSLPPLSVQLLAAGEASGSLAALAGRAADALDLEVQRSLTKAVTLVEPLLILVFGALIGFVALGLLQAIYGINASTL